MNMSIRQFAEEVMAISGKYSGLFSGGLPGMSGGAAQSLGVVGDSHATSNLQAVTGEFMGMYEDVRVGKAAIAAQADKIEGLLMMEVTLSTLSQQKADHLITALRDLVELRS